MQLIDSLVGVGRVLKFCGIAQGVSAPDSFEKCSRWVFPDCFWPVRNHRCFKIGAVTSYSEGSRRA